MNTFQNAIHELRNTLDQLEVEGAVEKARDQLLTCIQKEQTIFTCGNGGSAADAVHFSAELVGRYRRERRGFRALSLTADMAALTAIGNDYGYEEVFRRQLAYLGKKGDVLIAISTSGNSKNVINACVCAHQMGITVIGLLGKDGGEQKALCDIAIVVPSMVTARVQEVHGLLIHILCEYLDEVYAKESV